MLGSQSLDGADTRNHLILEGKAFRPDLLQNPQRAVIKGGITPYQEGAALTLSEFLHKKPLVFCLQRFMPFGDTCLVISGCVSSFWCLDVNDTIIFVGDEAPANI